MKSSLDNIFQITAREKDAGAIDAVDFSYMQKNLCDIIVYHDLPSKTCGTEIEVDSSVEVTDESSSTSNASSSSATKRILRIVIIVVVILAVIFAILVVLFAIKAKRQRAFEEDEDYDDEDEEEDHNDISSPEVDETTEE